MKPVKMNDQPIPYKGEGLTFYESAYVEDGTRAVICETAGGMPYATVSINLGYYGIPMADNEIALNHDLSTGLSELFVEHFGTGKRRPVRYGYAESEIIELREVVDVVEKPDAHERAVWCPLVKEWLDVGDCPDECGHCDVIYLEGE